MGPVRSIATPPQLLLLGLAATCLVYWIGLQGPFLLDDPHNLQPVQQWLQGKITLHELLSSRIASPFGRPLALASLAASAQLGGFTPFAFKLGNLVVHLLCGAAAFALFRQVAMRDPTLAGHANRIALLVAAIWLLHPLNASTVLYAVQRMAQMSTLFMLLAMLLYIVARGRLALGTQPWALVALFVGIPLLTGAGVLSKENAIAIPALCVLLEFGCFRERRPPPAIHAFIGLYLLAPLVIGLALLAWRWDWILGGYDYRVFDLQERLLSQARALCEYLCNILLPNPARMGVYTDDFAHSTSLLSPPTTLLAILALMSITAAAWRFRDRLPPLFMGWGIFLAGHVVESSALPLELYFEHRNYFPMLGILYAAVGLAGMAIQRHFAGGASNARARVAVAAALAILAVLSLSTHLRARTWSDETLLVEAAARSHPYSMRAQLAVVSNALRRDDSGRALLALDAMTRAPDMRVRAQGHLNRINLGCAVRHAASGADVVAAVRNAPPRITKDEAETFELLFDNTRKGCVGITHSQLADAAAAFADGATRQPDGIGPKAELRHVAARFHAREGDWPQALAQASLAWQPGMPAAASQILIRAQLATGDIAGAERTYAEASRRAVPADARGLRALRMRIDVAKK